MGKIAKRFDVSACKTIDMVLDQSGTGWEPELIPAKSLIGPNLDASNFRAVVNPKTSEILAFTGKRYRHNSHTGQLQALEPLVRSGEIIPSSVSVWDGGATIAYQFRVPALEHTVTKDRTVSDLLTLAFWHNGLGADRSFFAAFNWFCMNQMGMVKKATNGEKGVRHSGAIIDRYAELVSGRIRGLKETSEERFDLMRRMTDKRLAGADLLQYFALSMGDSNSNETVKQLMTEGREKDKLRGMARTVRDVVDSYRVEDAGAPQTVWHAYNGVTRYVTHNQGRNEATRSARALLGTGQSTIGNAWQLAASLAA